MNRCLLVLPLLFVLMLFGCSADETLIGEKPPELMIQIGTDTYETILGTYCWSGEGKGVCVDTAGPIELLQGKEPIKVEAGEEMSFMMNYEPKPTELNVMQIHDQEEYAVKLINDTITAPLEKGIYYYAYSAWWMSEKEANVSLGDACYAFAIEVQ